jgi:hypothetical protein
MRAPELLERFVYRGNATACNLGEASIARIAHAGGLKILRRRAAAPRSRRWVVCGAVAFCNTTLSAESQLIFDEAHKA